MPNNCRRLACAWRTSKIGEAYARGAVWSSAPPERLVVVEHHGGGWLTARRDDDEHERLRAADLTGPYDAIRAQHEQERVFRGQVLAKRLTWEELRDGRPCPGCGRALLGPA